MAKSKLLIAAELKIAALELELNAANNHVLALEARIAVATQVFKDQRNTIRDLEAKLNTRGVLTDAPEYVARTIAPIVTRFTKRDGSAWEKTRVGNRAIVKELIIYN